MADVPTFLLPHRVDVEPYLGETGTDDSYGPKVSAVMCRQEGELLTSAEGARTGSVKLFLRLDQRANFPLESRVTLALGQGVGYVSAVAPHDDGGAGAWQHLELAVR